MHRLPEVWVRFSACHCDGRAAAGRQRPTCLHDFDVAQGFAEVVLGSFNYSLT